MHIYATQDQLAKAVSTVSRVIQPQNNMAVLAGIQLDARDNHLTLSATDLVTLLQVDIPVEVTTAGSMVLPATLFTELVQRIPTATLELDVEPTSGKTIVKYGKNRATLHSFGNERLPAFQNMEGPLDTVTIGAGVFQRLARELLFSCAKDETRPILRGVSLTLDAGRLVLATTDGTRLSHTWIAVPEYRGETRECVVPAKLIAEAARVTATEDADLTIGSNLIQVKTPHTITVSRLLDGQYPDYQRVIPQQFVVQGRVRVSDFRGALERANLIAQRERISSVRIRHQVGQLDISASAQEFGQTYEAIEFDSHGQELDLIFNPTYLLDALKSFEGEEAVLEFSGVQSPLRLRDTDNAQYSHVVLPLRQLV